jgi:hypothetical protein
MPKKYQSIDTDPDSDEDQPLEKAEPKPSEVSPLESETPMKIPRKYKNKYNIEPEKVVNAIKEGKVQLTNKQVRKLIAPEPKEKRVLSDEHKARLAEQLKRGRETIAKNKLLHGDTERQERLKRKEALIAEKSISVAKPPKGRPRNKPAPEPTPAPAPTPTATADTDDKDDDVEMPPPVPAKERKFTRRKMVPSSDTETDADTTDTAQIKKVKRKLKMVRDVPTTHLSRSYADLSIAEKLLAKLSF